jgi:hypothetical protein
MAKVLWRSLRRFANHPAAVASHASLRGPRHQTKPTPALHAGVHPTEAENQFLLR